MILEIMRKVGLLGAYYALAVARLLKNNQFFNGNTAAAFFSRLLKTLEQKTYAITEKDNSYFILINAYIAALYRQGFYALAVTTCKDFFGDFASILQLDGYDLHGFFCETALLASALIVIASVKSGSQAAPRFIVGSHGNDTVKVGVKEAIQLFKKTINDDLNQPVLSLKDDQWKEIVTLVKRLGNSLITEKKNKLKKAEQNSKLDLLWMHAERELQREFFKNLLKNAHNKAWHKAFSVVNDQEEKARCVPTQEEKKVRELLCGNEAGEHRILRQKQLNTRKQLKENSDKLLQNKQNLFDNDSKQKSYYFGFVQLTLTAPVYIKKLSEVFDAELFARKQIFSEVCSASLERALIAVYSNRAVDLFFKRSAIFSELLVNLHTECLEKCVTEASSESYLQLEYDNFRREYETLKTIQALTYKFKEVAHDTEEAMCYRLRLVESFSVHMLIASSAVSTVYRFLTCEQKDGQLTVTFCPFFSQAFSETSFASALFFFIAFRMITLELLSPEYQQKINNRITSDKLFIIKDYIAAKNELAFVYHSECNFPQTLLQLQKAVEVRLFLLTIIKNIPDAVGVGFL